MVADRCGAARAAHQRKSRAHNFTNESGYGGTTRFLKNIVGLWILQESRRVWAKQGIELDYASLTAQANEAEPFRSLINPNAARFAKSGDMPALIAAYCRETAQPPPETRSQFVRCILESLALSYRAALEEIEGSTGRSISRLHIVGGGSQSALLNQFAANATVVRWLLARWRPPPQEISLFRPSPSDKSSRFRPYERSSAILFP